jgi:FkbM family methyltransferase
MKDFLKEFAKSSLQKMNIGVTSYSRLQSLNECESDLAAIFNLPNEKLIKLAGLADKSKSQLKQDLFVLLELDFKRNGFFVEFGATNGIGLSNSYLLEKEFLWDGIVAEPAKVWHKDLRTNRSCNIETNCVWRDSDSVLTFNEGDDAELSTIADYAESDFHNRTVESTYQVKSISLNDLLSKYNAPEIIDYLSIDTEGSEYEILKSFDFNKYKFNVITCEHNFAPIREKIYKLLTDNGYVRKYIGLSRWDDWYVRA